MKIGFLISQFSLFPFSPFPFFPYYTITPPLHLAEVLPIRETRPVVVE